MGAPVSFPPLRLRFSLSFRCFSLALYVFHLTTTLFPFSFCRKKGLRVSPNSPSCSGTRLGRVCVTPSSPGGIFLPLGDSCPRLCFQVELYHVPRALINKGFSLHLHVMLEPPLVYSNFLFSSRCTSIHYFDPGGFTSVGGVPIVFFFLFFFQETRPPLLGRSRPFWYPITTVYPLPPTICQGRIFSRCWMGRFCWR